MGCSLAFSEMISAEGLARRQPKTLQLIDIQDEHGLVAVQVFGANPGKLATAASIIEQKGADLIDLNMGCPVRKVVKTGAGAALLKDKKLVSKIVNSVRKSVNCPITVKLRAGWERGSKDCLDIARIAQNEGADAVSLHPRSWQDQFSGNADWQLLAELKNIISIPVIGSGDIFKPQDAIDMFRITNCDAVMIARGMVGNPWLLKNSILLLQNHHDPPASMDSISCLDRINMMLLHARLVIERKGEKAGIPWFRKQLAAYLKALPRSKNLKSKLFHADNFQSIKHILQHYTDSEILSNF
jgi:nifR3 family TIM-barrel protein